MKKTKTSPKAAKNKVPVVTKKIDSGPAYSQIYQLCSILRT